MQAVARRCYPPRVKGVGFFVQSSSAPLKARYWLKPTHEAGAGVVKGILDLKAKGYEFVRLDDATEDGSDDTTN